MEESKEPRDFIEEANGWLKPPKPLQTLIQEDKEAVINELLSFLKDGGDYQRKYAAFVLGQIGDDSVIDTLRDYYSTEPKRGIQEALGAAIVGLAEAPMSKGFSEYERRKIIDAAYDKNPLKFSTQVTGNDSSKSTISRSGCFIATAAYGSQFNSDVLYLQKFRDVILLDTYLGRKFVEAYYSLSPIIANIISHFNFLRWYVRNTFIRPLVLLLKLFYKF